MLLLGVRELVRQFDVEPVFSGVTFDVRTGERIALVGPNGTGKTTLLRCLAGLDDPDAGTIERAAGTTVALLEQQADFEPGRTLVEEARSGLAHVYALQQEALELAERMSDATDSGALASVQKRYEAVQHELERLDGYHVEHRVDEVLHGLGFADADYERPLESFSGGQQNRVLLARMLLRDPDVMLLDEPTNHLDIAATEWLEGFLAKSDRTMLIVSHDRYFLDRVALRTLEINGGKVTDYAGNFSAYWEQRQERQKVLERTKAKQDEFVERAEDFVRRNAYGQKHAQAQDRVKKLERLERVETLDDFDTPPMRFAEATRTGDWVVDASDVAKGFGGDPLFENVTLRVHRGDRLGILGPNGSGKTTLLRVLIGELPPDAGTVRLGANVKVGYFDQHLESVDPERDAVEAIRPTHDPTIKPGDLRDLLARFGIRGELALQKVKAMSGGERSKVALARLAASDANVLVLDEPTNHLDLWARESLEDALKGYEGTLLFVSHDRYFLDRVATSVVVLEPDRVRFHEGNYSDYQHFVRSLGQESAGGAVKPKPEKKPTAKPASESSDGERPKRRKRRFKYRKVDELEAEIAEQEELLESLEADMADPEAHRDGERMRDLSQEYEATQARLEELYEHWEEAMEMN